MSKFAKLKSYLLGRTVTVDTLLSATIEIPERAIETIVEKLKKPDVGDIDLLVKNTISDDLGIEVISSDVDSNRILQFLI